MIDKVTGNRVANDAHPYLIALFKAVVNQGWVPPTVSETEYNAIRLNQTAYPPELVGFVGFCCTFGAKWFGGYARGFKNDGVTPRNMVAEATRNLLAQAPRLKGVYFFNRSYQKLSLPPRSIIYCDPPYANTTEYKTGESFDTPLFWEWVRAKHAEGHTVYVSEYTAPADFQVLWEKQVNSSLTTDTGSKKAVEKLFTIK